MCVCMCVQQTCSEFPNVPPGLARAAKMAVVVVPIFDPSERGYALSILMTPIPEQEVLAQ